MSIVADQVRRLDAQLDRIPLLAAIAPDDGGEFVSSPDDVVGGRTAAAAAVADAFSSPRARELLRVVRALSTTTSSEALLPTWRIQFLLSQAGIGAAEISSAASAKDPYEAELEWLLVSKATIQTYGAILGTLLDQIIPLNEDIWYWDEVLGSYANSSLYTVQTSPLRLWALGADVYRTSLARVRGGGGGGGDRSPGGLAGSAGAGLVSRWRRFYEVVSDSVRARSVADAQRKVLSPVAFARAEARRKQLQLKRLRQMTASGLGVLVDEGLTFAAGGDDDDAGAGRDGRGGGVAEAESTHDWKGVVERSVALMDMVLRDVLDPDATVAEFEDRVFAGVEEDPELSVHVEDALSDKPAVLARRLAAILGTGLPDHVRATRRLVSRNGRPSRLTRYWLPLGVAVLSSSTVLRILVNRRADIATWISDLVATARDFWANWVVEPVRKVVGTIRHDAGSEIALMSRDSLRADRESLERMVVDFAVDKPQYVSGGPLSETQIADIRAGVAQGDVTPVLRAYEKELKSPLAGAVRGDLLRSLLIQVQKTKVDLEVAIGGIDALLKSQELVFGFVGLTPGILVSLAAFRYLQGLVLPGHRRARKATRRAGRCVRVLRNIDRIFAEATPAPAQDGNSLLSYRDHGLLLCEVHVLRGLVRGGGLVPREVARELLEDLDDLANVRGIRVQARALERIRWAYAKWLF